MSQQCLPVAVETVVLTVVLRPFPTRINLPDTLFGLSASKITKLITAKLIFGTE